MTLVITMQSIMTLDTARVGMITQIITILSITLGITTLDIMTLGMTTLGIMALAITFCIFTLGIQKSALWHNCEKHK
jgi:hypothetical protein